MKHVRGTQSNLHRLMVIASALAPAAAVLGLAVSRASAATQVWTSGATGDIGNTGNYAAGSAVPSNGDSFSADGAFNINYASESFNSLGTLGLNINSGAGVFQQAGGTLTVNSLIMGGGGGSRHPTYNLVNNSVLNISSITFGNGTGTAMNVGTGCTVNLSGSMTLGVASGANASINVTGGTFNDTNGSLTLGSASGGTGTINVSGGTFNANSVGDLFLANSGANNTFGNIILSGSGVLNATSAELVLGQFGASSSTTPITTGTLTMSGTSALNVTGIDLSGPFGSSYANGVINLNGGTISAGFIQKRNGSLAASSGNYVVNANGGTIVALGNSRNTDFFAGSFINLQAGGLAFNTGGNTVTITNAMSGTGGFAKIGNGQLTLSGTSTFNGATAVSGGTLNLTGALNGTSGVTVSGGATLTGTGTIGGSVAINAASTFALTGTSSGTFTANGLTLGDGNSYGTADSAILSYTANVGTVEPITVGTGGTANGVLTLNASGAYVPVAGITGVGTYTLLNFGSQTGPGSFSLSPTTAGVTSLNVGRVVYSLTDSSTSLVLGVGGTPTPGVAYFDGAVSNVWKDTSSPSLVNFSSNLTGTADAGNVPGSVTDVILNASTKAGSAVTTTLGSITINSLNVNSQSASNTINADGSTLTINALADSNTASDSSYTGNSAGTGILIAVGSGAFTVNVPVILGGNGANQTWTNNASTDFTATGTISATGLSQVLTLTDAGSGNTNITGTLADGTGKLSLNVNSSGTGVVNLTGSSAYTGSTTIAAGTLQVGAGGTLNVSGGVSVGTASSSGAMLSVAGGTINQTGGLSVATTSGVNATVGISSGTFNYNSGSNIQLGASTGSIANFTMTGGIFNSTTGSTFFVDNAGAGITTGNITLSNNAVFSAPLMTLVLGQFGDTTNAANVSVATLMMSGSSVMNVSSITLGCNNNGAYENGIINLNGGTLSTSSIHHGNSFVAATATSEVLNANGGTLIATADNTSFLNGIFVNLGVGGLTFNSNGHNDNINNNVSGVGGLIKTGTGTVSVSGSSSYFGATLISGGTLALGNGGTSGSLPVASVITDNSVLSFNRTNTAVQGTDFGRITGSGSVVQAGGGITQLSLSNSYGGTTSINGGILEFTTEQALYGGTQSSWTPANIHVASGAALGIMLGTGGFSTANAALLISNLSASSGFSSNSSVALDDGNGTATATYSVVIADNSAGPLGLIKIGGGSVALGASNMYTGGTNITNGTLVMGNQQVFGPANSPVTETGTGMIGIPADSYIADSNFDLTNYAVNYSSGTGVSFQNYTSALSFLNIPTVRLGAAVGTPSVLSGDVTGATSVSYFGPGTLTMAGALQTAQFFVRQGTVILSGSNATANATAFSSVGLADGDNATLVLQNGAIFTSSSDFNISDTSGPTGNTGVVLITDASSGLNVTNLYVGKGNAVQTVNNNIGTLNQPAGNVTVNGTLQIATYGVGTYNLSGGTLTMNGNSFTIAAQPGAVGNLNVSGTGSVADNNSNSIFVVNGGGAGTSGSITLSGNGSFSAPNATLVLGQFGSPANPNNPSTATLTLSGSSTFTSAAILLGGQNATNYTSPVINLNGGIIITNGITRGNTLVATGAGAVAINANGGTIQATTTNTNYFAGDYINLQTGGLTFNTAGNTVTSTTGMTGGGGFTKIGPGTLTLTASSSYSGPTNVNGGVLVNGITGAIPAGNNVTVANGATFILDSQASANSLGSVNLNGNMIVYNGDVPTLTAMAAAGYNNGNWNGATGILSSAAAGDPAHLTAVGVIRNDDGTNTSTPLYSTFEGQQVLDTDVLLKYTYYGDLNLDGEVDGTDYSRIDNAYVNNLNPSNPALTGWFNGDLNYDGVIDGSDYALMDNAFNSQGAQFASQLATATAQVAGTSAVPEPATIGILGMGLAALLGRRRKH